MKETIIKSPDDFHKRLGSYRKTSSFKFRGQGNVLWELVPKAGRSPFTNVNDSESFRHWKRRAMSYLDKENYSDIELLAIAQHTGLPTRLLDWTHNPLAAAFFATVESSEVDGAVFVYKPASLLVGKDVNAFKLINENTKIGFYQPISSSNRIANQFSYFSIHSSPSLALNDETKDGYLEKLIIKKDIKKELLFVLNQYGVNYLTLFPDLEGLSKHLSWFAENYKYWDNTFDYDL